MKKRKTWVMTAAAVSISFVLAAGCGRAEETQEEIVVPKGQEAEASPAGEGTIREQVQAPEFYEASFQDESGRITVKAAAAVAVPEAAGFRLKQVESRVFEQEDYDIVNKVLLDGGKMWERVDDTDAANGYIEKEMEAVVQYDAQAAEGNDNSGVNHLVGFVTAHGNNYFVSLSNALSRNWRWISFNVEKENGHYVPMGEAEGSLTLSVEEIQKKAEEDAAKMGFMEFAPAGGEYFAVLPWEGDPVDYAYGIHFTRMIDGIPVTYTSKSGTSMEDDVPSWPYEAMYLAYDDEGTASFGWTNPYMVSDLSEETVFLLPFEEIQKTFESMILEKYKFLAEAGARVDFEIDEVRLGYARIIEKGKPTEGTLVPVWDFFGKQSVCLDEAEGGGGEQIEDSPFESWITINAMDATVIDRGLGY